MTYTDEVRKAKEAIDRAFYDVTGQRSGAIARYALDAVLPEHDAHEWDKAHDIFCPQAQACSMHYKAGDRAVIYNSGLSLEQHAEWQMGDLDEYRKVYAHWPEGDPCAVDGCSISQQEHHRLAYGWITELKELREFRRIHEGNATTEQETPDA